MRVTTAEEDKKGVEECGEMINFVDKNPLPGPTARVWLKGGEGVKILLSSLLDFTSVFAFYTFDFRQEEIVIILFVVCCLLLSVLSIRCEVCVGTLGIDAKDWDSTSDVV